MTRPETRPSRLAACLLVALAAGWSGPAAAQPEGERLRVLVVDMQRGEDVSSVVPGRVFEYLKTILEMSDGLQIFSIKTLQKPPEPEDARVAESDPTLVEADEALWKGKELMDKGEHMKAVEAFKIAMAGYERRMDRLVDFDKYVDAALAVALAYFAAGYDDNGEDALVPVVVMRPDLLLDKRKVAPAAMTSLERLKRVYAVGTSGEVSVTSRPEGAEVFVDGKPAGVTPLELKGLWRGRHHVKVALDRHHPVVKSVVASNRDQTVRVRLKPDGTAKPEPVAETLPQTPEGLVKAAAEGSFGAGFRQLAGKISEEYALDAVILTYIRKTPTDYELAPFVYERVAGQTAELEWIHLDHDLATMQVNLLILEEKLLAALKAFPRSRVLTGTSRIYEKPRPAQPPVAAVPGPAVPPRTAPPATAPPATAPPTTAPPATAAPTTAPPATAPPATAPPATARPTTPPPRQPAPLDRQAPPSVVRTADGYQVDDTRPGLGAYGAGQVGGAVKKDKAWYQKWWVWFLAAGAVAGGTTAAVMMTRPDDSGTDGFRATVAW